MSAPRPNDLEQAHAHLEALIGGQWERMKPETLHARAAQITRRSDRLDARWAIRILLQARAAEQG